MKRALDQGARLLGGDAAIIDQVSSSVRIVTRKFGFPFDVQIELHQETMGRVFLGVAGGRFRGDASLATYASNVAKYTCLEHLRRERRERREPDLTHTAGEVESPERSLLRAEEHRRNLRAIASLPPEQRELLMMVFVHGRSYDEVATALGVSPLAVRLRVHRCRARLKQELKRPTARQRRARARREEVP